MKKLAIIGTGYVGLVTGTCFAELGNHVVCLDVDASKIETLLSGRLPFFEPSLLEMVQRNAASGRLRFSTDLGAGIEASDVVFIAVGTPMDADGRADLRYVEEAARTIARHLNGPKVVVYKSTVPVRTGELIECILGEHRVGTHDFAVVSNPEFLREGSAVGDFMEPDRVIVGTRDEAARNIMEELYAPLGAPVLFVDVRTAEMIKYTANAFLATKISFINEVANICDIVGASVDDVRRGIGLDKRIGFEFLLPGIGYGGSCFPKDMNALTHVAESHEYEAVLLRAVTETNYRQVPRLIVRLHEVLGRLEGRRIGVLGISFKPNTDDTRDSPALTLIEQLCAAGAELRVHDPVAPPDTRLPAAAERLPDAYAVAYESDALILATEWNEYRSLDLGMLKKLMNGHVLLDGRNVLDREKALAAGFTYLGVGRAGTSEPERVATL
jgi:UDPglucose 6-dehydrogenase